MHSETTTTVNGPGEVTQLGGFIGRFSGGGSASIGSLTRCRLERRLKVLRDATSAGELPGTKIPRAPFGLLIGIEAACCQKMKIAVSQKPYVQAPVME